MMNNKLKEKLQLLIDRSSMLGLEKQDVSTAQELLHNLEFGLSLDTVVNQLYEYDIHIDKETFDLIEYIIEYMNLPKEEYSFVKDLCS